MRKGEEGKMKHVFIAFSFLLLISAKAFSLEIPIGTVTLSCPSSYQSSQPAERVAVILLVGEEGSRTQMQTCAAKSAESLDLSLLATNPIEVNGLFKGRLIDCLRAVGSPVPQLISLRLDRFCQGVSIEDQLQKLFRPYAQRRDFMVAPDIPKNDRLETAYKELGVPDSDRNAIAFFNASFFGSGDEGMIFTSRGLYFRTSWTRRKGPQVGFIPFGEFASRTFEKTRSHAISLGESEEFVTVGSGLEPEQVAKFLNEVKQLLMNRGQPK